jgi:hypothetical protein
VAAEVAKLKESPAGSCRCTAAGRSLARSSRTLWHDALWHDASQRHTEGSQKTPS